MRIGIVGGGIVGLTLARELIDRRPDATVVVLEKEDRVGAHQTDHNSGVVHAGLYYQPNSLKATLCTRGRGLVRDYCAEHAIPFVESGKVVVARDASEIDDLREIQRRAVENGVPDVAWLDPAGLAEVEPYAVGAAAVHSPRTAVVDFGRVARAVADEVTAGGGEIRLGSRVVGIRESAAGVRLTIETGPELVVDRLVLCAGLQSDRVATLAGGRRDPAIVPFLGRYHAVRPGRTGLVRSLIYPVPDPRYPFLGVHLTRTVDGRVLVGPNAVLALAREGYRLMRPNPVDLWDALSWSGFRAMARRHWRQGTVEVASTASRHLFAKAARRYVPELHDRDLVPAGGGIRAQAVWTDGRLADDFVLEQRGPVLAVRNAPSPAATSSFAIAEYLADRLLNAP